MLAPCPPGRLLGPHRLRGSRRAQKCHAGATLAAFLPADPRPSLLFPSTNNRLAHPSPAEAQSLFVRLLFLHYCVNKPTLMLALASLTRTNPAAALL